MVIPGRQYVVNNYRFGYNGKENDNDVEGLGNQQNYGMRIYDPRLGRFLSIDPLAHQFAYWTPFQFSGNNPIKFVDLDGEEPTPIAWQTEFDGEGKAVVKQRKFSRRDALLAASGMLAPLGMVAATEGGIAGALYEGYQWIAGLSAATANYLSNPENIDKIGRGIAQLLNPNPLDNPDKYIFRGTTEGFEGGARALENTAAFTSKDPLVATLFGIKAQTVSGEKGVLLLGKLSDFEKFLPPNS
jgi:RHS repeat-associated protein